MYNNGIYIQKGLNLYKIHIKKTRKATDSLSVAFRDICCQLATMRIFKWTLHSILSSFLHLSSVILHEGNIPSN